MKDEQFDAALKTMDERGHWPEVDPCELAERIRALIEWKHVAVEAQAALAERTRERDEARTVLNAWMDQFGTTQLTHATAELSRLREKVEALDKLEEWLRAGPPLDRALAEIAVIEDGRIHIALHQHTPERRYHIRDTMTVHEALLSALAAAKAKNTLSTSESDDKGKANE